MQKNTEISHRRVTTYYYAPAQSMIETGISPHDVRYTRAGGGNLVPDGVRLAEINGPGWLVAPFPNLRFFVASRNWVNTNVVCRIPTPLVPGCVRTAIAVDNCPKMTDSVKDSCEMLITHSLEFDDRRDQHPSPCLVVVQGFRRGFLTFRRRRFFLVLVSRRATRFKGR
jgi:hypothetical protein